MNRIGFNQAETTVSSIKKVIISPKTFAINTFLESPITNLFVPVS